MKSVKGCLLIYYFTRINTSFIIAKLKSGDPAAFRELVENYRQKVFNTAISFVQHEEWAEDIAQEVFIEVFQSIDKFNGLSGIGTWIYRITVNKCLDSIRAQKRQKRFAFVTSLFHKDTGELIYDPSDFVHPGVLAERKEKAKVLFKTIDELPENQKAAFILSQIEELSQKEIAEILNTSVKAVESLIQRAKITLRKKLENIYENRRK